jgi:UDP-N-acetylglucosamine enolpyruvyl transferase
VCDQCLAAACVASGLSVIDGAHYVERGYADIPAKITQLGGRIEVVA